MIFILHHFGLLKHQYPYITYCYSTCWDHVNYCLLKFDSYSEMVCTQVDSVKGEIYFAFNASHLPVTVSLPERPGYQWEPLVDTGKSSQFDFLSSDLPEREVAIQQYAHFLDANLYPMLSYSSVILLLSPEKDASSWASSYPIFPQICFLWIIFYLLPSLTRNIYEAANDYRFVNLSNFVR